MADLLRRPGPAGEVAEGVGPVTWSDDGHPAAVLFDLDGTLIDSEPLWSAAVGTLVREHGRPWHLADDAAILGWSIPALSAEVVRRGVRLTEAQVVDRLHHDVGAALHRGVPWRPGARHLLAALHRSGIPLALVSATHRVVVEQVVTQAPDGVFTTVVTGDDPGRPKPAPDPYLRAAQILGVDAAQCVAVEDSPTGVRSALASGARTLATDPTITLPADLLMHPRLHRVDGLEAVGRTVLDRSGW